MKVFVSIPIAKKMTEKKAYTFDTKLLECVVVKVHRYSTGRKNSYYYQASVKPPIELINLVKDFPRESWLLESDGLYRTNIIRKQNPKWKPPKNENFFKNIYDVA